MNKAIAYLLSQMCKSIPSRELNSIYALINMMSNEELIGLRDMLTGITNYDDIDIENFVNDVNVGLTNNQYDEEGIACILEFINDTLKLRNATPNRSITELLELLTKNSDNQMSVVRELCDRFEYQSFEDQKRIIKTLLHYDHMYVSRTILTDYWAKLLIDDIMDIWQRCEGVVYNSYIIQFADEEFVWRNIDRLSTSQYDYVYLCRRLGNHPDFNINPKKLYNEFTYYSVLKSLGREIDGEEVLEKLFSYIRDWIVTPRLKLETIEQELRKSYPNKFYISSKLIPIVSDAIWSLSSMELTDEMLYLYNWDSDIRQKVNAILDERYAGMDYNPSIEEMWLLYCELARQYFPEKFSYMLTQESQYVKRRNEMIAKLSPLIEKYSLEIEEDEDFSVCVDKPQSPSCDYMIIMPDVDEAPF